MGALGRALEFPVEEDSGKQKAQDWRAVEDFLKSVSGWEEGGGKERERNKISRGKKMRGKGGGRTVNSERPLLHIRPNMLFPELECVIIHVVQVVLHPPELRIEIVKG